MESTTRLGFDESELEEQDLFEEDTETEDEEVTAAEIAATDRELTGEEAQSALEAMLSSTPQAAPTESYKIKRLGFAVMLQGISERQIDLIGRRSERSPSKTERGRGVFGQQRDINKFNLLLVTEGMLDPDLTNRDLMAKFGPRPEDVVRQWFLPGEIIQLADLVMDLSGYSDEAVKKAKK
jgi:hypothetical protein